MPAFNPYREIPGYAGAVEQQELVRSYALTGRCEQLCGLNVMPFTFRHWNWLEIIGSPFVGCADFPTAEPNWRTAIAGFFLTIAPDIDLRSNWRALWRRKLFLRKVNKLKTNAAIRGILDYRQEAFMDIPGGHSEGGESYFAFGAAMIHRLCLSYGGLTPDGALDLPVKTGFQLLKQIQVDDAAKNGKRKMLFNPSDEIKSRWLEQRNNSNN